MEGSLENRVTLNRNLKNYLILLAMVLVMTLCKAQSHGTPPPMEFGNLTLSVSQDLKFATFGDKERGYYPITRDVIVRSKWEGLDLTEKNREKTGLKGMLVVLEYETAALQYGFERYSAGLGISYDGLLDGKWFDTEDSYWRHTLTFQYGWIVRDNFTTDTYLFTLEHSTRLLENVKFIASHQYMYRSDLGLIYNDAKWKYSFFLGIEVDVNYIYKSILKL